MANTKGFRLMPGEVWSKEFKGYIDKGNGLFKKPRKIPAKDGSGFVYHHSYFFVSSCHVCGKQTMKDRSNMRKSGRSVCSKDCFDELKRKPNGSKKFKRGSADGHVMVKQKDHPYCNQMGDVAEHRLVIEKEIGRYLLPTEYVHHINLIKSDNRIENLVLFKSHSEHFKAHGTLNKCVAFLIDRNVLTYNRETNSYEVI